MASIAGNITDNAVHTLVPGRTGSCIIITNYTVHNRHATQGTTLEVHDGEGGSIIWLIAAGAAYGGECNRLPKRDGPIVLSDGAALEVKAEDAATLRYAFRYEYVTRNLAGILRGE